MDPEKRKREGDDNDTEKMMNKKKNPRPEDEEEEEEVEEFFAILRRIHAAVKYFEKADRSDRRLTATAKTWKPSFKVEDFEGDKGGVKDLTEDNSGLDLNSEPAIEM